MKRYLLLFCLFICAFLLVAEGLEIESVSYSGPPGSFVTLDEWWYSSSVDCYTETGIVDIVFCVDTSGSMSGTIDDLYMNIGRFAHRIESMGFDGDFGLQNYCSGYTYPHGATLIPDAATFSDILSSVSAADGGYECHYGAALDAHGFFSWRSGAQRIIIVVSDEADDCDGASDAGTVVSTLTGTGTVLYMITPDEYDYSSFMSTCSSTGGQWFDIDVHGLDDVLDMIVDDFAIFENISIVVTNTSGGSIPLVTATLMPDSCILLDVPSTASQTSGPIADGGSASFNWDIDEIEHCDSYGDCFFIMVEGGGYSDTLAGCLFIEDCGCPGPEAIIIEPEACGAITACANQPIVIEFRSYLAIDPSSIQLIVNGSTYTMATPGMSYNPGTKRLTYTPPSPWPHDTEVTFRLNYATDITGCELTYTMDCNFHIDTEPPETHEVAWSPPCGSTLDPATDVVTFSCWAHDEPAGMTLVDDLSSFDSFMDIIGSVTAVTVSFNGIPYIGLPGFEGMMVIPHIGWPLGELDTNSYHLSDPLGVDPSLLIDDFYLTNIICLSTGGIYPECGEEDWLVEFSCPAELIQTWALGMADVEVCFNFQDLVESTHCGPNDTSLCCTYHFPGGLECAPAITEIGCPYPCGVFSSCPEQYMEFTLEDTLGQTIDTTQVYFTVEVRHPDGSIDTYHISEPSANSWFTAPASSVTATVGGFSWETGDSVFITLDSLFTEEGCRTIP